MSVSSELGGLFGPDINVLVNPEQQKNKTKEEEEEDNNTKFLPSVDYGNTKTTQHALKSVRVLKLEVGHYGGAHLTGF